MKKLGMLVVSFCAIIALHAQPPNVPAESGAYFGEKFTATKSISVNNLVKTINKMPEGKKKISVQLKGKVSEVCSKEGCWIKIKSADGKLMVKMKDHKFGVPMVLNGKKIIIDGIAEEKITSVDLLRHYAEDAGKSKEEIAAIKEPKKEIVIIANGIQVL